MHPTAEVQGQDRKMGPVLFFHPLKKDEPGTRESRLGPRCQVI